MYKFERIGMYMVFNVIKQDGITKRQLRDPRTDLWDIPKLKEFKKIMRNPSKKIKTKKTQGVGTAVEAEPKESTVQKSRKCFKRMDSAVIQSGHNSSQQVK